CNFPNKKHIISADSYIPEKAKENMANPSSKVVAIIAAAAVVVGLIFFIATREPAEPIVIDTAAVTTEMPADGSSFAEAPVIPESAPEIDAPPAPDVVSTEETDAVSTAPAVDETAPAVSETETTSADAVASEE